MEFAFVLRELWERRLVVAIGILVAAVLATLSVYRLEGFKLKARSLQYSSASTQILVDTPSSVLGDLSPSFDPLNSRAVVYANFMASPAVLELIGQQVGLRGDQIYAAGPVDTLQPRTVQEPTALKRNVQLTGETVPYRFNFNSEPNLPTIGVYSQAPATQQAIALANAAAVGLQRYVANLQKTNKVPRESRVVIRQLGHADGGVVNSGISKSLAGIVFGAVFLLWCVLVLVGARLRQGWRESGARYGRPAESNGETAGPGHAAPGVGRAAQATANGGQANDRDIVTERDDRVTASEEERRGVSPHMAGRQ
jgi:hypothetical protein